MTMTTPLAHAGISKHDVASWWGAQPFDLRLPVVKGKTVGGMVSCAKPTTVSARPKKTAASS